MSIEQFFPEHLEGRFVGSERWKLIKRFIYHNPPTHIVVPVGFITDGASVPKVGIIRRLIGDPWSGKYARAAVIHDYGYFSQIMPRIVVDKIFLNGMKILGVSWWRRGIMYNAIRLVAWIHWNKRRKEIEDAKNNIGPNPA